jgi:hypothetical protein
MNYILPPGLHRSEFKDRSDWWPWKDGRPIRSVSKILERVYPMPPDLDPWYLERGRMVHAATVMIDNGTLDWATLDERLKFFCDAYKGFIDMAHPIIEAREIVVVHPSYRFGGRIDMVLRFIIDGRLCIGDIKCGMGREDRYWCQVAGLAVALDEDHVADYDLALLNLDNKGRAHFTVADDSATWINRWREVLADDALMTA